MELGMRFDRELELDGDDNGELDGSAWAETRGAAPRRASERTASLDAGAHSGAVTSERRHTRFEAITVRAAARVLQLQQAGIVSSWEAGFYLHELVDMDRFATRDAYPSLLRLARRHPGHRTLARVRGSEEPEGSRPWCLDHPACMGLELALLG